jgi:large subunit ribosomal protein L22
MEFKVKLSNFRTAPRKVRHVADLVRGKPALQAQTILLFTVNKSAKPVLKLLNSAIDAAKKNKQLSEENLFVSKITVDEGPKLKRWHPMSRGRAYPILKRTSHIVLVLSDGKTEGKKVEKKSEKVEKTQKAEKTETTPVKTKKTSVKKTTKTRKTIKK